MRAGAARLAPGICRQRRRTRRDPGADPATETKLRSPHRGPRSLLAGGRGEERQGPGAGRFADGGHRGGRSGGNASGRQRRQQRLQSRHFSRTAGRLHPPVEGPGQVRDRRFCPERRHRPRQTRLQHRGIGTGILRQRRPQVLRQSDPCPDAGQQRRGRGNVRRVHGATRRCDAKVRSLPVERRLPQRSAPACLGFLRCAAGLSGLFRRPVQERRPAGEMACADRHLSAVRRRSRRRIEFPRQRTQQWPQRHRRWRAARTCRWRHRRQQQLARWSVVAHPATERADPYGNRLQRQSGPTGIQRPQPGRDRRFRLEVRAQRQHQGKPTSSCRASTSGARNAAICATTATARSV